jgi:hypothetical protein
MFLLTFHSGIERLQMIEDVRGIFVNRRVMDNRIRPGFVVLLVGVVAGVVLLIWFHGNKSSPPGPFPVPAADIKPGSSTERLVVVKPEVEPIANPAIAAAASAAPAATAGPAPAATSAIAVAPVPSTALEKQWGIQVTRVELTAGDSVLDLCYKVTAPEKTALLYDSETSAYLIDQASGAKILMGVPPQEERTLPPRSRARSAALMMNEAGAFPPVPNRLTAGKTYFVLVPNPGGIVKRGNKVAVILGNFKSNDLTVE